MRYIRKRGEPQSFKDWKRRAKREPDGLTFPIRDRRARNAALAQMHNEQGGLCAYTMWPLSEHVRTSIEHIYCQEHHPDRALDYGNMVLCAKGTLKEEFDFGEARKGNLIVTDHNFVSPLNRNCETRFVFHNNGLIEEATSTDQAAKETISVLNLNDETLKAARQRAIRQEILGDGRRKPVSAAQARRLAETIARARFGEPLPAFAVAIQQSALRFADEIEKRAQRLAARQNR